MPSMSLKIAPTFRSAFLLSVKVAFRVEPTDRPCSFAVFSETASSPLARLLSCPPSTSKLRSWPMVAGLTPETER